MRTFPAEESRVGTKDLTGSFSGALPVIAVILVAMVLPIVTRNPAVAGGGRWSHLAPRRRAHA